MKKARRRQSADPGLEFERRPSGALMYKDRRFGLMRPRRASPNLSSGPGDWRQKGLFHPGKRPQLSSSRF